MNKVLFCKKYAKTLTDVVLLSAPLKSYKFMEVTDKVIKKTYR